MKKICELDIFKGIAAIMVILIHITAAPIVQIGWGGLAAFLAAINRFSKPSVPMFIFASGFALYYVYGNGYIRFRYPSFMRDRFTRILIPYVFWCVVYFFWGVWQGTYEASASFFVTNLLNGKMMYHLYFMVAIIQFYILFGLFYGTTRYIPARIAIPAALVINIAAVLMISQNLYGRSFTTYIIYFLIGCYAGRHADGFATFVKKRGAVFGLIFAITGIIYIWQFVTFEVSGAGGNTALDRLLFMAVSISGMLFIYDRCIRINEMKEGKSLLRRMLLIVNDGSFYIYLSHPLAMQIGAVAAAACGVTGALDLMCWELGAVLLLSIPGSILYVYVKRYRAQKKYSAES